MMIIGSESFTMQDLDTIFCIGPSVRIAQYFLPHPIPLRAFNHHLIDDRLVLLARLVTRYRADS